MSEIVLVHGAWSDGSIWQDVVCALRHEGHAALVLHLPMTSLTDDVAWTRKALALTKPPVTLVGHSYGGMVISAAAAGRTTVRSLVYVAAYAPEPSDSVVALSERGARTPGRDVICFGDDGWTSLDPDGFHRALADDLPPELTRVLAGTQRSTHVDCLTSPAGPIGWHDLPCSFVVSDDDRILDPGLQRSFADRTDAVVTALPSSHLSPVARPRQVAQAISDATQRC